MSVNYPNPETVTSPWKAITRSVVGVSHQKHNQPCQDASAYRQLDQGLLLGAIADGAGSASHAETGAQVAVQSSLDFLQRWHEFALRRGENQWVEKLDQDKTRRFFEHLLQRLHHDLRHQAQQLNCEVPALASTLLVFIAHPQGLMAMQLGDGFLVVHRGDGDYQLLFTPDKGEFTNETVFVTSDQAVNDLQVYHSAAPVTFIAAATDGLESVAIKQRDWTAFPPFFQPLEIYLQETPDPEQEPDYLENFLTSERLNQRTQDDKTLLLAYYAPQGEQSPNGDRQS
ncbi:MAG: PP2C family serine/threonine-protein phosphatase [Synechocystis sp.]|nr:PP2C family serine/threonine-protein phosphatase [Synechocystis sp.]